MKQWVFTCEHLWAFTWIAKTLQKACANHTTLWLFYWSHCIMMSSWCWDRKMWTLGLHKAGFLLWELGESEAFPCDRLCWCHWSKTLHLSRRRQVWTAHLTKPPLSKGSQSNGKHSILRNSQFLEHFSQRWQCGTPASGWPTSGVVINRGSCAHYNWDSSSMGTVMARHESREEELLG